MKKSGPEHSDPLSKASQNEGEAEAPSKEQKASHGDDSDMVQIPRGEYELLMTRLKELESMREQLLRAAADFDNAKKRLHREKEEFMKFSHENFIRSILPVLDNFERAMAHVQVPEGETNKVVKGIVMGIQRVHKQFLEILKNLGLSRISTDGENFDPHRHEAVAHVEGEGPADQIVDEVEAGYMLHDRLVRAAKVRISIPPKDDKSEELT